MKRIPTTALGLAAILGVAAASPAMAHGPGWGGPAQGMGPGMMGQGQWGGQGMGPGMMDHMSSMMPMMMRMHGSMMGGMGMGGGMGMMGPMGAMTDLFDSDENGVLTADELRAGLTARLEQYDADGDGRLSLEEFEGLHAVMVRPAMVDRFQALDENGDGAVTGEEITAPADKFARMERMREAMRAQMSAQGRPGRPGTMMGNGRSMMDDDDMMDDN